MLWALEGAVARSIDSQYETVVERKVVKVQPCLLSLGCRSLRVPCTQSTGNGLFISTEQVTVNDKSGLQAHERSMCSTYSKPFRTLHLLGLLSEERRRSRTDGKTVLARELALRSLSGELLLDTEQLVVPANVEISEWCRDEVKSRRQSQMEDESDVKGRKGNVLGDTLASGGGTSLDLTRPERNNKIRNERILRLTRPM